MNNKDQSIPKDVFFESDTITTPLHENGGITVNAQNPDSGCCAACCCGDVYCNKG